MLFQNVQLGDEAEPVRVLRADGGQSDDLRRSRGRESLTKGGNDGAGLWKVLRRCEIGRDHSEHPRDPCEGAGKSGFVLEFGDGDLSALRRP